ncbi:MAG: ABC transporter substrate-binding protein [Burkholderiales bacterium]|nr:ABC transporter substrate-binding protein [Burkholderiales bacterium]
MWLKRAGAVLSVAVLAAPGIAHALDKVKAAGSQRNFWDTTVFYFADEATGVFKNAGIELEVLWTQGGSDCQQSVVTGSMDVCMHTGILGAIAGWAKGAPIAIISATSTGAGDLWWYTKADTAIRSIKDTNGKTVAFSRPGSSTNLLISSIVAAADATPKLVSTGGPSATLTQVMSGQIDVGWSAGIFAADLLGQGKIRRIASGNDAPGVATQTIRVNIAGTEFLKSRLDVAKRFMAAYREAVDWAYTNPKALEMYAAANKSTVEVARTVRDQMYPRSSMVTKPIGNVELSIRQAIADKMLSGPLSPEQIREMLRYVDILNP